MSHFRRGLRLTAAMLVFAMAGLLPVPVSAEMFSADDFLKDPKPLNIKGDSVEYFFEENRAEAVGNVRIEYGNMLLTADKVEANMKTKEAWADGNVVLTREGEKHTGDSIYVNFETGVVDVKGMETAMLPFYRVSAGEVVRTEDETLSFRDASLTTCDEDEVCEDGTPYYSMNAKEIEYVPDVRLTLRHVVLRAGKLPLLYLPILVIPIKHIRRLPVQTEFGRNSEWGAFALNKVRYYLNDDHDGNLLGDIRQNQGLAYGIEHFYRNETLGRGTIRGYFANDSCGDEDQDCSRSKEYTVDTSDRYRVQARHRGQPIPGVGVNAEINKMSDERVIQDFFFRDEFERIAFPDNYVSAIHAKEDYTLSGLARFRLDDFVGVVERLPEATLDFHTRRVGESDFYVSSQTQGAALNRTYPDFGRHERHDYAGRVDTRNVLSYVWKVGDWTATPFAASRQTFYTRQMGTGDRDFVRSNMEAGVDVSTKFFKVYDFAYERWGMSFEKLRHVFTPNIRYFFQSKPTHVKESLYQFDSRDNLDRESTLTLDFENKLQIKYMGEDGDGDEELHQRTILRSIVAADLAIPQGNQSRLETIRTETDFYPMSWLKVSTDANYTFEDDEFNEVNVDVSADHGDVKIGFGQRYLSSQSNQSTVHVEWLVNPEWKLGIYDRYDFEREETDEGGRNNEFEFVIEKRNFFCWTIRLVYNRSHRENAFYVTLSPSAFAESSFRRQQYYRGK